MSDETLVGIITTGRGAPGWGAHRLRRAAGPLDKDQQRMALSEVVYSMHPDARDALIGGLSELAAADLKAS